jgi:hypothetical protein
MIKSWAKDVISKEMNFREFHVCDFVLCSGDGGVETTFYTALILIFF